jgi:hypothetical protein
MILGLAARRESLAKLPVNLNLNSVTLNPGTVTPACRPRQPKF